MPKFESQAGTSLARSYSVKGGIVGIDQLDTTEVNVVHELGATMFSERLKTFIIELEDAALQSATFSTNSPNLPDGPLRILGATVLTDGAAEVESLVLSIRNTDVGGEIPFFNWNSTNDVEGPISVSLQGAATAVFTCLRTIDIQTPNLVTRIGAANTMPRLQLRGTTLAFGAGTNTVTALIYVCRANPLVPVPGDPSSHGLPLPGW